MPLNRDAMGRTYPVGPPYEVTLAKVREFATAIGDDNPVYRESRAAAAAGFGAVIAPPTFAYAVSLAARRTVFDDPTLGLVYGRAVHGEHRFTYVRPIRVGDELTARCTVTDVSVRGDNEILSWREEILNASGELVCTSEGKIVSRGTAA